MVCALPHMEMIASLVALVAYAAVVAGWVATVTHPTNLNNVRNRVVGILLGLLVSAFVFNYIWPEGARIEISTSKEGMSIVSYAQWPGRRFRVSVGAV
jgi:hypothetical protein